MSMGTENTTFTDYIRLLRIRSRYDPIVFLPFCPFSITSSSPHDNRLPPMILARVAVTTVNHDSRQELGLLELLCDRLDVLSVKIGAMCRPAQDYVADLVAFGADNGRKALLCDGEEVMSD
ncbi:hypothetical protein BC937DRAFT_86707 [Endogone sp. FLAS-F59071]|nr:hypothetical protein BC937DRAFT_86707 [Endogone sp. FLAS-F59071]|eukprot:RUS19923.1 hypothetical protein BC937DRAFT_86707 [Endogone sp. FLAS-F59071]